MPGAKVTVDGRGESPDRGRELEEGANIPRWRGAMAFPAGWLTVWRRHVAAFAFPTSENSSYPGDPERAAQENLRRNR